MNTGENARTTMIQQKINHNHRQTDTTKESTLYYDDNWLAHTLTLILTYDTLNDSLCTLCYSINRTDIYIYIL